MKSRISILALALVLGAAFTAAPAHAGGPTEEPKSVALHASSTAGTPSQTDRTFLAAAAQGNMAEVSLGELALKRGGPQVQKVGAHMVADHSRMLANLQELASAQHVTLPSSVSIGQKAMHAALDVLSGKLFDKAYIDRMVADHRSGIAAFENEEATTRDSGVKQMIAGALPTMREHLHMFESLKAPR